MYFFPSRLVAWLGLAAIAFGCSSPAGPPLGVIAPEINATFSQPAEEIAPGDILNVRFPFRSEWDHEAIVSRGGRATFIAFPEMSVAGMRVGELSARLSERYETMLDNPDVSISFKQRVDQTVSVLGDVETPGTVVIPPGRRLTLLEALAQAGGARKETAYLASTVLARWSPETGQRQGWVFDARPRHWDELEPIFLQDYDVVYVPNKPVDDVGIWIDNYIRRMIPLPRFVQ